MPDLLLAIDLGTTGVKALVFDDKAAVRGTGSREVRTVYPKPGWVEQPADSTWESVQAAIGDALEAAGIRPVDLRAIGISNQRSSIVAWDDKVRELSPIINWQDTRGAARCDELGAQGFFVQSMMAASKAEWIVRNIDEAAAAARNGSIRLGTPDSWLVARLSGGIHVSEHSNASSTGMYAHFRADWDDAILDVLGLERAWLPDLADSSGELAVTSREVFGAKIPIAAICADQQSSLFGLGCHTHGAAKISYGTSASVNAHSGDQVAMGGPGTFPLVAWKLGEQVAFCVEGQVITAGAAIQWLRDGLGAVTDAAETSDIAAGAAADSGVWAVPAFQGLGTPEQRPEARALIGGLSRGSGKAEIVRAVLEGVAHRIADAGAAVWQALSEPPAVVRADGGASANQFLLQAQADLIGIPIERSPVRDGAALGAALLAGLGAGVWSDIDEVGRLWHPDATFVPAISTDERETRNASWRARLNKIVAAEL